MDESTSSDLEARARVATDEVIRAAGKDAAAGLERRLGPVVDENAALKQTITEIAGIAAIAGAADSVLGAGFALGRILELCAAVPGQGEPDDEPGADED